MAFLVLLAIITLFPLFSFALAALQPRGTFVSGFPWPPEFHWENFVYVWKDANFGRLVANSFLILVAVVPATIVLSFLAGYGFAVLHMPGKAVLYLLMILGLTIPLEMIIIPLYFDFRTVGLLGTYWPIILTQIGLFMPFGTFWMTAHFKSMPVSILEAARVDGAGERSILWRVLLPGAGPALTTLGVLTFVWTWNQFLLVLVLVQDPSRRTAPSGLGFFVGEHTIDVPSLAAASFVVMAPPLIVYLFFQRQFIAGTIAGALKE